MSATLFVAVEGLDGTGKSTLAAALARALDATLLRTPPEELAPVRGAIDATYADAGVAAQLFYASTVAYVSTQVRALRAAGRSVVVDRYWLSTRVYARCRAEHVALDAVEPRLVTPDVTVFLDVDEATRVARVAARGATYADRASFRDRIALRAAYDEALAGPLAGRVVRVDTTDLTPDACLRVVLAALACGRAA